MDVAVGSKRHMWVVAAAVCAISVLMWAVTAAMWEVTFIMWHFVAVWSEKGIVYGYQSLRANPLGNFPK